MQKMIDDLKFYEIANLNPKQFQGQEFNLNHTECKD